MGLSESGENLTQKERTPATMLELEEISGFVMREKNQKESKIMKLKIENKADFSKWDMDIKDELGELFEKFLLKQAGEIFDCLLQKETSIWMAENGGFEIVFHTKT